MTGGDADIPTFTLPTQMLAMAGFRAGSWYSPPGVASAKWHVQSKVAQGCANLQFTQEQDRTRDFGAINAQYVQFRQTGMNVQVSAGEVSFPCTRAGQPMTGYYFASTLLTNSVGNGIWAVDSLYGYLANPGAEESAAMAMSHGLETFQFNVVLRLVDARDPVSGRELKVDNAANYHWIDVNGKITGTQTDTRPAAIDPLMLVTLP